MENLLPRYGSQFNITRTDTPSVVGVGFAATANITMLKKNRFDEVPGNRAFGMRRASMPLVKSRNSIYNPAISSRVLKTNLGQSEQRSIYGRTKNSLKTLRIFDKKEILSRAVHGENKTRL
jgi:hypothetical protein